MTPKAFALLLVAVLAATTAEAEPETGKLLKVVIVSRHGVRKPLQEPKVLNLWTQRPGEWPQDWNPPGWPHNGPGDLTKVGADLVALMGAYYHNRLELDGLFSPTRCPDKQSVFIRADVDNRTVDTGKAIAQGFAKGFTSVPNQCQFPVAVLTTKPDPLFHPTAPNMVCPLRAGEARNAITARLPPGGFPEVEKDNNAAIGTMRDVLQCCQSKLCVRKPGDVVATCRLADLPTYVNIDGDKVKMEGTIGISSTASEIFLLEYANGMPMSAVGWNVVDVPKLATLLTLHNLQFEYMDRTLYIAKRQGSMLLRAVLETLQGGPYSGGRSGPMPPAAAKFVAFVGHDTNVANLAAMLGVDWPASEELPDKTAPAGALVFELREDAGAQYVLVSYVAQKVAQMRPPTPISKAVPPYIATLRLGCAKQGSTACSLGDFATMVGTLYDRDCLR